MKSPVRKRAVTIDGRHTSVSIEDDFWSALHEIAGDEGIGAFELIARINFSLRARGGRNLSSALRLFALDYYVQRQPWRPSRRD